ncbi:hypothetical protein G6F68_012831 [Rhizopus microsporus]|nr:hypothetical protein G6F68_012831 [Rhizopus microsporus]
MPAANTLNGQIPRDLFIGEPDFDRYDTDTYTVGYAFEHAFNDRVKLRQSARYFTADGTWDYLSFGGLPANGQTLRRGVVSRSEHSYGVATDTSLELKLDGGPLQHTVLVGLAMASFILMTPGQHLAWRLLQLAFFGAVNSLQFTVMNTVTLRDLDREFASSGNSLLSMVMMLAAGFGAAAAGSLLAAFGTHLDSNSATAALHATFLCVGAITLTSTMIFWQLPDTKPEPRQVEHVAE